MIPIQQGRRDGYNKKTKSGKQPEEPTFVFESLVAGLALELRFARRVTCGYSSTTHGGVTFTFVRP